MRAKTVKKYIDEGYGAGFSLNSFRGGMGGTSRGGFGGANNLGGPNMMYTYEIKPLNHTLEQKPTETFDQKETIQIGSKVTGYAVKSITYPEKKKITGIVRKIEQTDNGSIKYYLVTDETNQRPVKLDPLTIQLIIHEPVEYYFDATNTIPSGRKQKIKDAMERKKIVKESLYESILNEKENNYNLYDEYLETLEKNPELKIFYKDKEIYHFKKTNKPNEISMNWNREHPMSGYNNRTSWHRCWGSIKYIKGKYRCKMYMVEDSGKPDRYWKEFNTLKEALEYIRQDFIGLLSYYGDEYRY